jgi:hypothetical protein
MSKISMIFRLILVAIAIALLGGCEGGGSATGELPDKGDKLPKWVTTPPKEDLCTSWGDYGKDHKDAIKPGVGRRKRKQYKEWGKGYERLKGQSNTTAIKDISLLVRYPTECDRLISDGKFNLWINVHEGYFFHKHWADTFKCSVLIDGAGGNIGYNEKKGRLLTPDDWEKLKKFAKKVVAKKEDADADELEIGLMGVSGFSNGCTFTAKAFELGEDDLDAAICFDGIHYSEPGKDIKDQRKNVKKMSSKGDYAKMARKAAKGEFVFVVNHSSITPDEAAGLGQRRRYVSTTITASFLIWWVGGQEPKEIEPYSDYPFTPWREFHKNGFHVIGFRGSHDGAHESANDWGSAFLEAYIKPLGYK